MKLVAALSFVLGAAQLASAWRIEVGRSRIAFNGRDDEVCRSIDRSYRGPGHHRLFFDDEERSRRGPDRECCVWVYKDDDCRERPDRAEEFCDRYDGETRGEFRSFSVDCRRVRHGGRRPF
jgi:hypothetical protein